MAAAALRALRAMRVLGLFGAPQTAFSSSRGVVGAPGALKRKAAGGLGARAPCCSMQQQHQFRMLSTLADEAPVVGGGKAGGGVGTGKGTTGGGQSRTAAAWEAAWQSKYGELREYLSVHGSTNVPQCYDRNPQLGRWVNKQREIFRRGSMSPSRVAQLKAIGFNFRLIPEPIGWEEHYLELQKFKEERGDCNVPDRWSENLPLAYWITTQRRMYKKGVLEADRVERLEALGFCWVRAERCEWDERFLELVQFNEEHGHCNVARKWKENPALGAWVGMQRAQFKAGLLDGDRTARLEAIGFTWVLRMRVPTWDFALQDLQSFARKYGSCNVPEGWNESPRLARWVETQRHYYARKGGASKRMLTPERRAKLEAIDSWTWTST